MYRYNDFARIVETGAPLANATITVTLTGTATLATLYSDDGVTPLANPYTAGADGAFSFYAANDRYDITVTKTGATAYSISDIFLGVAKSGTFTFAAAALKVVAETFVRTGCAVLLFPANATAGTLLAAHGVYVAPADHVDETSFTARTADGAAAAGTEVFSYLVVV